MKFNWLGEYIPDYEIIKELDGMRRSPRVRSVSRRFLNGIVLINCASQGSSDYAQIVNFRNNRVDYLARVGEEPSRDFEIHLEAYKRSQCAEFIACMDDGEIITIQNIREIG